MMNSFELPNQTDLKKSAALVAYLKKTILNHGGYISFATFMDAALYYPELGYYESSNFSLGKSGDFITAPHLTPLFAQCVANEFMHACKPLPTKDFLELGAGTGQFAHDFIEYLKTQHALPDHYFILEKSHARKLQQQAFLRSSCYEYFDKFIWLESLLENFSGMIFANEVLDALPCHRFKIIDHKIYEECIVLNENEIRSEFIVCENEILAAEISKLFLNYSLADQYISEVNLAMNSLVADLTKCLHVGVILFADYGYGEKLYYHPERNHGTLTCFYRHQKHVDALWYPGLQDITAHINFTKVAEVAADAGGNIRGFTTQANFLLACGILSLAENMQEKLSAVDIVKMNRAIKMLTMPTEMGEVIKFMAITKTEDFSLQGFDLQDRRREL